MRCWHFIRLAPWSMAVDRDLWYKNFEWGVKGACPRMLPPPLGERGGHPPGSTERNPNDFSRAKKNRAIVIPGRDGATRARLASGIPPWNKVALQPLPDHRGRLVHHDRAIPEWRVPLVIHQQFDPPDEIPDGEWLLVQYRSGADRCGTGLHRVLPPGEESGARLINSPNPPGSFS